MGQGVSDCGVEIVRIVIFACLIQLFALGAFLLYAHCAVMVLQIPWQVRTPKGGVENLSKNAPWEARTPDLEVNSLTR